MPPTATPWAVILAGGDGTRLRPLTQHLTGDGRPKQLMDWLPEIATEFAPVGPAMSSPAEGDALDRVYESLPTIVG